MKPIITLLYVPADRPERVVKAFKTDADVVVLDLEDAVSLARKNEARVNMVRLLTNETRAVQVRINQRSTMAGSEDIRALGLLPLGVEVRIPKVESADEVREYAEALPGRKLHVLLETALGVENAFQIATATSQVASIGLGEADLRSDLRLMGDVGLSWARSRIVNAARAAKLPSPHMSVYPYLEDRSGLVASSLAGKQIGLFGRAAIHPNQLSSIREAFYPSKEEIEKAHTVLARIKEADIKGSGTVVLEDGSFLDAAFVEHALAIREIAENYLP